jgi:hypothetical protein
MKKDTFYFTHDFFARKDPKCIALLKDFGMVGYGVYWSLIEIMYEQGGKIKKFPSLFSALAHELNIKESVLTKQIEAMLHSFELLVQDENYIWSDAVLRRLEIREQKKLPRVLAGKAGGIKSGESRRKKIEMNQNEALLRSNEANEPKERKEKESKENRKYSSGADAPRAHWNLIVEQWFLFNQEKFGEKPSFAGADPRHLKKIIDIIERRAMDKNIQWTEQYAIKRFKDFLSKAYQDDWLSKNFLLRHLENFIDKIILNQNGNGKANGQGHAHKPVITGTAEGSGKFE